MEKDTKTRGIGASASESELCCEVENIEVDGNASGGGEGELL